jgi:hypothetical protein
MKKYKVTAWQTDKGKMIPHQAEFQTDATQTIELYQLAEETIIKEAPAGSLQQITIWIPMFVGEYDELGSYKIIFPKSRDI